MQPGETLSSIADDRLGDAAAWPAIWDANAGATMVDGRTFDDPDLIVPGWELAVPVPEPDPLPRDEPPPLVEDVEADEPTPNEPPPADEADEPTPSEPRPVVEADEPAPDESAPSETETAPDVAADDLVEDGSLPMRVEHGALLAGGLVALAVARRRAKLRSAGADARIRRPSEEIVSTERTLRARSCIDDHERDVRIDVALRAAAAELATSGVQVGLVAASPEGDIELRLTGDAELSEPWRGTGPSWELPGTVPIESLADRARQVDAPCVALAPLGVLDDGSEALLDLEACGVLTVDADPAVADAVVKAIAVGLGSSLYAETAQLITVSLPGSALLGHRNTHVAASTGAAFDLATDLVGTTIAQERTTFELRASVAGGERWEPAIVLLSTADGFDPADHVAPALPGRGIGVVAAVASPDARDGTFAPTCRLVQAVHGWSLEAFGCTTSIRPIGVVTEELDALTSWLAEAECGLEAAGGAEEPPPTVPARIRSDHAIVVGLMGPVTVTDREGVPATFERSKTVELIAWLATHRETSSRIAARTALWELDVRDATFANVVSEARRGLGRLVEPPDGHEWLERTLNEQLPLHERVATDADLIEERLEVARLQSPEEAVDTLRPAVEMIRDVPFSGTNYLWPDAEGLTSSLVLLATSVTTGLAVRALAIGDTELVFWATGRGLRVLPGHEELIGLRMRAHAHAGDLSGVRQEWEAYERVIVADPWTDGEPAPKLLDLRHELLGSSTAAGA